MSDGSLYVYPERGGMHDGTARSWQGRDGRYHDTAGENSRTAQITQDQAQAALDAPRRGEPGYRSARELAAALDMTERQVRSIWARRTWTHLRRRVPVAD